MRLARRPSTRASAAQNNGSCLRRKRIANLRSREPKPLRQGVCFERAWTRRTSRSSLGRGPWLYCCFLHHPQVGRLVEPDASRGACPRSMGPREQIPHFTQGRGPFSAEQLSSSIRWCVRPTTRGEGDRPPRGRSQRRLQMLKRVRSLRRSDPVVGAWPTKGGTNPVGSLTLRRKTSEWGHPSHVVIERDQFLEIPEESVVSPGGIEPSTNRLRVCCSAN